MTKKRWILFRLSAKCYGIQGENMRLRRKREIKKDYV